MQNSVSLYIHIPFCKKKCDYCDFYSISQKEGIADDYISAVLAETRFYANFYKVDCWKTVYVGGGTPSLMSPRQLEMLILGIKNIAPFDSDCEITVEMNPESVCESFIDSCMSVGVNRLSLGIQALDDKALSAVHRICDSKTALRALDLLSEMWNGRLSVDFIAGLPNHTYSSFKNQFEKIFLYELIDHISLYTLTIEENTPLGHAVENSKIKFSYEKADKMWLIGRTLLEKKGFRNYEISNFAKPGHESRHNTTYWKLKNYIGCGAGATGSWYGDYSGKLSLRWTNTLSLKKYIDFWIGSKNVSAMEEKSLDAEKLRSVEKLDFKTLEFEFLMMGFRMLDGVSSQDFKSRFKMKLEDRLGVSGGVFAEWKKNRLATVKKNASDTLYSLNRRGILLLNRFLEELI
ncbi:radical SAM family heme chaperone HemW [Treponema zioleckii]|uniref:radical SAM family heme chaperone HemW n=1 Tax=Treponema zioleckii TaxID=331680 RepID=UPI00168AEE0A|nr:radical SAM family heme chaperone HemW [Treponema zioleckii]